MKKILLALLLALLLASSGISQPTSEGPMGEGPPYEGPYVEGPVDTGAGVCNSRVVVNTSDYITVGVGNDYVCVD